MLETPALSCFGSRGATALSKLGVQFLGIGYCTENQTRMVYPVSWTAVSHVTVTTLFIKKVGVVRPFFFGGGPPPNPPVVAPLFGSTCTRNISAEDNDYDELMTGD